MSVEENKFIDSIFSPTSRRTTFIPKTPIPTSQSRYTASPFPMAVSQSRYTASSRPTFIPKTPVSTSQSRSRPTVSQSRSRPTVSQSRIIQSSVSNYRPISPSRSSISRSPTRRGSVNQSRERERERDLRTSASEQKEESSEEESSEEESSEEESSEEESSEEDKEFRRKYKPNPEIYSTTSFSYGLEYEPSSIQYYDHNSRYHYDREVIDRKKDLKITIEKIDLDKKFGDNDAKKALSCKYNLEIDIGPFLFDNISNFLSEINGDISRKKYVEKTLVPILNYFEDYINEDNQDYLRFMKMVERGGVTNYQDCAMMINKGNKKYDPNLEIFYTKLKNRDKIDIANIITGRPQITIGISYAFLPYLASYYLTIGEYNYLQKIFDDYDRFVDSNPDLFGGLSPSSLDVFKGFVFLILYTSSRRILYVSKEAGGKSSYIKSTFPMKPRTNLVISYQKIIEKYRDLEDQNKLSIFKVKIDENLDRMREELNRLFGVNIERFNYTGVKASTEENDSIAMTDIVNYKMDMLNAIAQILITRGEKRLYETLQESAIYGQREYPGDYTSDLVIRLQFISAYINRLPSDNNIRKILNYFMYLDSSILLYDIFNPVKSVKVFIIDKNKLGKENICESNKILDGYLYSYIDGRDKDLIDQLVTQNLIQIEGLYDYAGQPPLLLPVKKYSKTYICTNFRQELFEWVPVDSNLVIELRGPEKLTYSSDFERNSSVKLSKLPKFYQEMFEGLNDALKPII